VAWFLIQSFLILAAAFSLGLIVGWLWWGRAWRKLPLTESQAVQTVAHRLETLIADRDAEIARLRDRAAEPTVSAPTESTEGTGAAGSTATPEESGDIAPPEPVPAAPPQPTDEAATAPPAQEAPPEEKAPPEGTAPPDDLKRIEGIGPRISTALHAAGITNYQTLARADEEHLRAALRQAGLSFAPSLVTWSRQAALLAGGDEAGFRALTSEMVRRPAKPTAQHPPEDPGNDTGTTGSEPEAPQETVDDDLERIEGIGPRISKALHAAGIHGYRQLADSDVPALKSALESSGLRFAPSLPTWPRQAAFLDDGDEDGFEAFTSTLVGGRDSGRKA
jgi:predicted flap endonuclease-1-like 5' DNA nuclease